MADLPKWHQFMLPLLEVLKEKGELSRNDAIESVVQRVGLTEEQMALSQESNGKSVARGRIGWASSYLRTAGALIGPKRGYFALGPNADALFELGRPLSHTHLNAEFKVPHTNACTHIHTCLYKWYPPGHRPNACQIIISPGFDPRPSEADESTREMLDG